MNRSEQLNQIIHGLRQAVADLNGVLIASTDGLSIAQALSSGIDPNRVAAMAATALGVGRRIAETLQAGSFSETSVRGSHGQIFLYAAGDQAILAVIATAEANVGLIHLEARDAARNIANVFAPAGGA